MFMAAAPEGASSLDFEAEEAGILEATKTLAMRLVVEESGALPFLEAAARLERRPVRGAASLLPRRHRRKARSGS